MRVGVGGVGVVVWVDDPMHVGQTGVCGAVVAVAVAVGGGVGGGGRVVGVGVLGGLVGGRRAPPPRALFVRAHGPAGRVHVVRPGSLPGPRSRAGQHDGAPFHRQFFQLVDAHDLPVTRDEGGCGVREGRE